MTNSFEAIKAVCLRLIKLCYKFSTLQINMLTRYLMRIISLFHGLRNYGGNLRGNMARKMGGVMVGIGDQIPSDGLFLEGHSLKVDESSMTGENKDKYLFGGIDQPSTQGKVTTYKRRDRKDVHRFTSHV
ncbi:hypothetical protein SO802_033792 [Lithocarpus litseifolius]|uniref:P-type ATPase A domain-containing protein n=1 Tax=Lithocarpus litseifolius TaxID=425828 RepID=A0AAW2BES0_9ROSI